MNLLVYLLSTATRLAPGP